MAEPRKPMSAAGRKRISQAMKARWRAAKQAQTALQRTERPNGKHDVPIETVAACVGYVSHAIEEFARRTRIPASVLAERVGEVLLHQSGR